VKPLIVIPLYNHASTVRAVAQAVLHRESNLLVVDDGSSDGGSDTLEGLSLHLVRHDHNQGKGNAILTAARWAKEHGFTHILTIDADGQHDPDDLALLLEKGRDSEWAIVIGKRDFNTPNVPESSKFGRNFSAFWAKVQTGQRIDDIQSGLRLYPLAVFECLRLRQSRYAFEMEVIIKALWAGFEVCEVDARVYYPPKEERVSHFNKWRDNVEISLLNTRLTFRALLPIPHRRFTTTGKTKAWTSKSVASAFAHQIFYAFIRCGGPWPAYLLLHFVVGYYTCLPRIRKCAWHYLKHRFGKLSFTETFLHTWRLNLLFGKTLVDHAVLGITGQAHFDLPTEQQAARYRQLLARGNGLIVITAHVGCWQMAMSCFDFFDEEKYVVYHRTPGDVDKMAHEHSGNKAAVHFIDPAEAFGGTIEIMAALRRNGVVCLMGDRHFGAQAGSIRVPFLGEDISVPASIYRIAAALSTPVLVLFFPRTGAGRFKLMEEAVFEVPERGACLENYRPEARVFTTALERFCEKYRYQFFNFYNPWQ